MSISNATITDEFLPLTLSNTIISNAGFTVVNVGPAVRQKESPYEIAMRLSEECGLFKVKDSND